MWEGIELQKLLRYLIFQTCPNATAYEALKNHFKDIEWLQFTGLLDKNGKEIYEGDICRSLKRINGAICWNENKCRFYFRYKNIWNKKWEGDLKKSMPWVIDNCEVIGNIYENSQPTQRISGEEALLLTRQGAGEEVK